MFSYLQRPMVLGTIQSLLANFCFEKPLNMTDISCSPKSRGKKMMEAMLAIKIVRQARINEIRQIYLKTNYLNVSALPTYQRGIVFSQGCGTGAAPPEKHFWGICREVVSNR